MLFAAASAEERLRHTSFAELTDAELAGVRAVVARLVLATPRAAQPPDRAGPRGAASGWICGGPCAPPSAPAATRSGWSPPAGAPRPRRLVLLCDVSGSMEPYTRVYLTLLQGAVAGARAEAFVFATRLTRLTRQLAVRNPDAALARAGATSSDWAGGTRLAEGIGRFVGEHGRRGLARGAVVVVLSDGWAIDDPERGGRPWRGCAGWRTGSSGSTRARPRPGYAPLVGGMAAALPYCDAFVSGHSLAALEQVVAAIAEG